MSWTPWKQKPKEYWAHVEWSTDVGGWERDIESHGPLEVTVSEFKDHSTIWIDADEVRTVFYAQAKPNSVSVEIDQNGSKLEVNP